MREASERSASDPSKATSGLQYSLETLIEALRVQEVERLLDTREVCRQTSLHRNTIYKLEQVGRFPLRRIIAGGKVVWLASEIRSWIQSRPTSEEARQAPSPTVPPRPASEPRQDAPRLTQRPGKPRARPG